MDEKRQDELTRDFIEYVNKELKKDFLVYVSGFVNSFDEDIPEWCCCEKELSDREIAYLTSIQLKVIKHGGRY